MHIYVNGVECLWKDDVTHSRKNIQHKHNQGELKAELNTTLSNTAKAKRSVKYIPLAQTT